MVGDFNISPWSAFYPPFEEAFNGKLVNVFRNQNPTYTWSLWDHNLFVSHIDHLFLSSGLEVARLQVGDLW